MSVLFLIGVVQSHCQTILPHLNVSVVNDVHNRCLHWRAYPSVWSPPNRKSPSSSTCKNLVCNFLSFSFVDELLQILLFSYHFLLIEQSVLQAWAMWIWTLWSFSSTASNTTIRGSSVCGKHSQSSPRLIIEHSHHWYHTSWLNATVYQETYWFWRCPFCSAPFSSSSKHGCRRGCVWFWACICACITRTHII